MKPSISFLTRALATVAVGAAVFAAVPQEAQAQDWRHMRDHDRYDHYRDGGRGDWDRDRLRRVYLSVPRSRWVVTYGTGYAGRGYYYGPPGSSYFYEAPGVRYFRTRSVVPGSYWRNGPRDVIVRGSMDARVQSELSRRGYYRGPVDGDLGPGSRAAIARFQADRGLPVTGGITSSLLSALGIY